MPIIEEDMNGNMYSKFMENYVSTTMEEYFSKNLDPERQNIRKILRSINENAEKIYLAGVYLLQIKDFPARQSVVAHCFRELINVIIRSEETLIKTQALEAIKAIDFVKQGKCSEKKIANVLDEIWNKLKSLQNERAKLFETLLSRNPKLALKIDSTDKGEKDKILEHLGSIITSVQTAKNNIDKLRHFDKEFYTISEEQFFNYIKVLEDFIKQLEQPQYMEVKEVLDDILEETNTKAD